MADINIMALSGSPRRGGNTEILLDEFIKGAVSEGAAVDRLTIHDAALSPCRGCQACFQDGRCIIADDMENIYPRLLAADIVVLASPLFFYGVPGATKILIDRAQALWGRKYVLKEPSLGKEGKKRWGFFISVGGTKGQKMFEGAVLTVKYFFDAFNVKYAGELLVRQVDGKGDILQQPQALADAFLAGRNIVREFRGQDAARPA
jgi:multimeric flavodoxin WrbA